jgi:hypothetical protein
MKLNHRMILLAVAGLFFALILSVACGLLDFLARDERVVRGEAIGSLAAYWLLTSLAIILVGFAARHWRNLLLALAAVLITASIAEAALRLLGTPWGMRRFAAVPSPEYHHIYPPHRAMFQGVYDGQPVVIRTNEDGLRTGYTREQFRRYHDRVVILGDSFVFGYGVRQERGLTAVMERLLRDRLGDSDVAVLNAGIPSYSPLLERRLLAGPIRQYQPTLIVLLVDVSDIGDDIQYLSEARVSGDSIAFDPRVKASAYRGALLELIRRLSPVLSQESMPVRALTYPFRVVRRGQHREGYDYYKFNLMVGKTLETNRFFIYRHPLEETRVYFSRTLQNINAIADQAERLHARFLLAINPRYNHWNPAESPDNWERSDYALDGPYQYEYFRFFDEVRSQVRYPVFSLLPAFQGTREFPLVFREDPHWNERGNAFAAGVLVNHLLVTGMIGR